MKKKYMNPEIEIVDIKIQQPILTGSETMNIVDPNQDTDTDAGGAEAPGFGDFDFDF